MSSLTIEDARALLIRIVGELYEKRHSPVPGALVKAQLISEAANQGSEFSEREYGMKSFLEFVRTTPEIAVQMRMGSDMLLAPATASDLLSAYARPLPRLRRDFWRAFIEFPIDGTIRLYDAAEDIIVVEQFPTTRKGIVINPVSREEQVAWRKEFAEEQPESARGALLESLGGAGTAIFNEFSRRLRENPTVNHAWNHFLQKRITDHVASWGTENGVSEERWRSGASRSGDGLAREPMSTKTHSIGQRAELYNFLDNLPIEDLLQLRVPLEWALKVTRDKR